MGFQGLGLASKMGKTLKRQNANWIIDGRNRHKNHPNRAARGQ